MQNIARDSENSSEEEFFDAHGQHPSPAGGGGALSSASPPMTQSLVPSEGFSDSDEVFPKEMTKWNSNDFIDAFASPMEAEGTPGKCPLSLHRPPAPPKWWGLRELLIPKCNGVLR